jgi:glutamate-1-semialdehyde 2,1-aminomutase
LVTEVRSSTVTADSNRAWFSRAQAVLPGGVSSPVRAFGSVGGDPFVLERGQGAWVWDVEGNRYLDLVQSYGASILGHADPAVSEAISRAASRGATLGATTPGEVLLAEAICQQVSGCQSVRFTSSGTEAAMTAIRLARGATGRDRVVKFAGCYHGHSDALLAAGGSGVATLGLAGSNGVPAGSVAETLVVPYNQVPLLDSSVACVIVEPVAANMGLVAPAQGFLSGLRRACDEAGALLIFDEVITGFRLGRGGAGELYGVKPDLWCFGKVIGGGLPIGAVGGGTALMAVLAPQGPVYQAGTLSGNPVATAAGAAVLSQLDSSSYATLASRVERLATGLERAAADASVALQVPRLGTLLGVFFSEAAVSDYDSARRACSGNAYSQFFRGMLDGGVALAPGPYEAMFVSLAHGEAEIDMVVEVASGVLAGMAG